MVFVESVLVLLGARVEVVVLCPKKYSCVM